MTADLIKTIAVDYIRYEFDDPTPVADEPAGNYVVVRADRRMYGVMVTGEDVSKCEVIGEK